MEQGIVLTLAEPGRARQEADRLFEAASISLASILPPRSDIRHVGATAVIGCLTKGDLDIVARVPADDFDMAEAALAARFARNEGSIRTGDFSAFVDPACRPHLGIQLVTIGGPFDVFHLFAEALKRSAPLVEQYNALKRAHVGSDMEAYRAAKDRFVETVLAGLRPGG